MKAIEAVLIGAGNRGRDAFGRIALQLGKDKIRFIAVADPNRAYAEKFAQDHGIPQDMIFSTWREILQRPQLAPVAFNATLDREHIESSIALMRAGYHLVLEKPMAVTPEDCQAIADTAAETNRLVQICHPLRFGAFYGKVKQLLQQGAIGKVLQISMAENIGYWHFAHSFVRGNWRNMAETGPMILTKCCHDMDIAVWLADSPVESVASFGQVALFREENAPAGAPARCTDGCPAAESCFFYAPSFYMTEYVDWPVKVISLDTSLEARRKALETGPYGRCVFRCDNDTPDEQLVQVKFENGILLDFAARGQSYEPYRSIRVLGTEGELTGHFEKMEIKVQRLGQGWGTGVKPEVIKVSPEGIGHGGGDEGVMRNFLRCFDENDCDGMNRSLQIAVEGHLLSFAAEEARRSGQVLSMKEFRASHRREPAAR
jgi:predicted dehydrogenase